MQGAQIPGGRLRPALGRGELLQKRCLSQSQSQYLRCVYPYKGRLTRKLGNIKCNSSRSKRLSLNDYHALGIAEGARHPLTPTTKATECEPKAEGRVSGIWWEILAWLTSSASFNAALRLAGSQAQKENVRKLTGDIL